MTKLWILLAVSLALAKWIDLRDQELSCHRSDGRDNLITWMLILVLGFFCGLRTSGNDTSTYIYMFEQVPYLNEYSLWRGYGYAEGMVFGLVLSLIKTLGFSAQDYLVFFAFATVIPYILFIRRFSGSMVFGVFLMFSTGFYTFTLAAIKQCMATALCLLAVMAAVDGKWGKYLLLVGLGSMFHPYSMVYLIVPLMMFKPWTYRTFIWMAVFMAVGFYLESLLGTVLDITDMMGADYTEEEFLGEGVNLFRVGVSFVPLILAMLYGKKLFEGSTKTDHLLFNLAMVNALIMFVGLFGTANYFARLANYFLPAQVIVLPWILRKAHPRDRAWLVPACIAGYLGYFIYENAIIRPFELHYKHISFWSYLPDLFS